MLLADWINLEIPWWFFVLGAIGMEFWPLTAVTALTGFAAWRYPVTGTRIAFFVPFAVWLVSAGVNLSPYVAHVVQAAETRSRQYTLAEPAVIGKLHLPAQTVITRSREDRNTVEAVDLKTPTLIDGVPVIGHVDVPGGTMMGDVTLARDAVVDGVPCSATQPVRLDFLGRLTDCTLPHPVVVRGVPCRDKVNVEYNVQCTLSIDYRRFGYVWGAGTLIRDAGTDVLFTIGPKPPTLRDKGRLLPPGTDVHFDDGKLLSITLPVQ